MRSVDRIIQEAELLPIEQRIAIIDALQRSIDPPNPTVEAEWLEVAKKRLDEIRKGGVKTVPGEQVFERIWSRFGHR